MYRTRYESRCSSKPKLHFKKTLHKEWRKTIFNIADGILTLCNVVRSRHWFRQVTAPCNVACGSGIMTVNSSSGSTLHVICGSGMTYHWIRLNVSPYWNSTSGFDFDHITAVDMSFVLRPNFVTLCHVGTPRTMASNESGVGKNGKKTDFKPINRYVSETV